MTKMTKNWNRKASILSNKFPMNLLKRKLSLTSLKIIQDISFSIEMLSSNLSKISS